MSDDPNDDNDIPWLTKEPTKLPNDAGKERRGFEDVLTVQVTPGFIQYSDETGPQTFYFQCNPASLSRSRTSSRSMSRAPNANSPTLPKIGEAGRKFTYTVSWWKIDAFEIWLDASNAYGPSKSVAQAPSPKPATTPDPPTAFSMKDAIQYVRDGIQHLEALVEPKHPKNDHNEHPSGYLPLNEPPIATLVYGPNSYTGYITSVTILEKEFTKDLYPRLVKATLSMELVPYEPNKTGARR